MDTNFKSSPTVPAENGCATIAGSVMLAIPVAFIPFVGLFLAPALVYAGWKMAKDGRTGAYPHCGSNVNLPGDKDYRHQKCRECKHHLSLRDEILYDLDSPLPAAPAPAFAAANDQVQG